MSQPAFDFGDDVPDDAADPTYSVSELADAINDRLRSGFDDGVWVRGEIDGLNHRGPHTYFSLIEDGDDGKAVLNVQLFAPAKRRITPVLRKANLELRDGMKVRVHGWLDFWAQGGRLGLKMDRLDSRYTLGEIAQSRDDVLRRLAIEGVLDANGRTLLARVPLRVGVVASVDSAAWADFRSEIERSGFGFELTVADTRVQGDGADRMVAGAIGTLARGARKGILDAIVVIRGGGARNELAVFDSERIARTIAAVPVPVFTGLGHEVDRSVADECAHTALKTPTACAGALVERVAEFVAASERTWAAILHRGDVAVSLAERRISEVAGTIARRTGSALDRADERLDMRRIVLGSAVPAALATQVDAVQRRAERLVERSELVVERSSNALDVLAARIASVDPAVQLARGWSITRTADGEVVRSIDRLVPGQRLTTTVLDGHIATTVDELHHTSTPGRSDA
ncbi:MAG: exodeoxyribonuclease VII large subunit [Actinomycetota bacterium]